jgi:hypothetical protein
MILQWVNLAEGKLCLTDEASVSKLGFLTKRFNAVSRNSETSETSGYFAKFFACFASVSRNVSRNSEKLKISRNNSKIGKLWLTSHVFLFSLSRNKITVSVSREMRFAETAYFAKQQNRRNDPFCFAKQRNAFCETFRKTISSKTLQQVFRSVTVEAAWRR